MNDALIVQAMQLRKRYNEAQDALRQRRATVDALKGRLDSLEAGTEEHERTKAAMIDSVAREVAYVVLISKMRDEAVELVFGGHT